MIRIGPVIIIAAVIVSIGIAMYFYVLYEPKFITVNSGEPVIVGPVKYIIEFDGTHNGNEDTRPEHTFVKIRIIAENLGEESTRMSGGQFYILDEDAKKEQPVFGEFSQEDLLDDYLEPNKPVTWTTQFDIPFDENKQYKIGILPTKLQSTRDIGIICLTNC